MIGEEIYQEFEELYGFVPAYAERMPKHLLKLEWDLWMRVQNDEGAIPRGYRELIGLGVSAAARSSYGTFYHTETAKAFGATKEEIESAAHFAMSAVRWSTFFSGMQIDLEEHRAQVMRCVEMKSKGEGKEVSAPRVGPFTREEVCREMEEMIGFVPTPFQKMSDASIGEEWEAHKQVWHGEGPIPLKYRHLIGLGVVSARQCPQAILVHTELAKLDGATEAEIEDAVHFAASTDGWATYLEGVQLELETFKKEIIRICKRVRSTQEARAA